MSPIANQTHGSFDSVKKAIAQLKAVDSSPPARIVQAGVNNSSLEGSV